MRATLQTDVDAVKTAIDTAFAQAATDASGGVNPAAATDGSLALNNEWMAARQEILEYLMSKS